MLGNLIGVLFDGVAYGSLLFVISIGLSVTMGLMNFVNLAHGAFAMLGGYVCVVLMTRAGVPFLASLPLTGDPHTEVDQDRRRDEDRGVGADQHGSECHRRGEAVDRGTAEEQQREQCQRHGNVGDDGTRQRRVDRNVDQLRRRHALIAPQHFADAIVDDDRVVQRIAENRQ